MKKLSVSLCLFLFTLSLAFAQTPAEKAKKSADAIIKAIDGTIKNAEIAKGNATPDPKLLLNAAQKDGITKAYLNYNLGTDTLAKRKADFATKAAEMKKQAEAINAKSAALKAKAETKPETEEATNALNEEIRKSNEEIAQMKAELDKTKVALKEEQDALAKYPDLKERREAQIMAALGNEAQKKAYKEIQAKKGN